MKILTAVETWKNKGRYDDLGMSYGTRLLLLSDYTVKKQPIGQAKSGKMVVTPPERFHNLKTVANTMQRDDFIDYWLTLYESKGVWRKLTPHEIKQLQLNRNSYII